VRRSGRTTSLRDRSILMVSTEQWFGSLLSKHYIVLEPSRHNRVLFILRRRRFTGATPEAFAAAVDRAGRA
jgi:hypothetical protein